jgi:hypothetical protein
VRAEVARPRRECLWAMQISSLLVCTFMFSQTGAAEVIPSDLLNSTKTFEVSATKPSKDRIVSVWTEARPERKGGADDFRVGYTFSGNNGKTWSEKGIIDEPEMMANVNPYVTSNKEGDTFLAVMHVEKSYFAGKIAFYQYDFKEKRFELKSVPAKSGNLLLDKPAIAAVGNDVHLVYAAYGEPIGGALRYQLSRDKGATWTDPVDIVIDKKFPYLGASIAVGKDNQILIACGSYGKAGMYLIRKDSGDDIAFGKPIVVSGPADKPRSGMAELHADGKGKLVMTWQANHSPGEVWMTYSEDEGRTWAAPLLLSSRGNLMSAAIDDRGGIHCICSDYTDRQYEVRYKRFGDGYEVLDDRLLRKSGPLNTREYIGAYQKLLVQKENLYAFWIDFSGNTTLNFARWIMRSPRR